MATSRRASRRWWHSRSRGGGTRPVDHGRVAASADMDKDCLSLKRVPTEANVEDYDVLCGGEVVGRIFLSQAATEGRKWMWASHGREGRASLRRRGNGRGRDGGVREELAPGALAGRASVGGGSSVCGSRSQ